MFKNWLKPIRPFLSRAGRSVRTQRIILLIFIIGLGLATLLISRAATTTVSIQPENGAKCNANLQQSSISGASGNAYVKFAANVCGLAGGEDVRGVKGEMSLFPTNPTSLIDQWLVTWNLANDGTEGAFRFQCKPSHLLYDDPIVKPGQPGKTHLHLFYGNETANANSTYESLRKNGTGTCEGGPLNRSAYWIPALIDGSQNKVILPDYVQVYYKVQLTRRDVLNYIPRGLRYIAGHPMDSGATETQVYGPANPSVPGGYYRSPIWKCYRNGTQVNESDRIPTTCQDGDEMYASVPFPFCWDNNRYLDSNDHRTHVVFPDNYEENCPPSHSIRIPEFSIITKWSIRTGDAARMSTWYLSSDKHGGVNYPGGKSLHADWFGAWDDSIAKRWVDNCLKGGKSCTNANLSDGKAGKRPIEPWYDLHPNRLVDIPPIP